jgi:hypothetical protein
MRDRSGRLCLPLFFSPIRPAESAGLVTTAMHTDEYEIALSRELAVCDQYVRQSSRVLTVMEQRHGITTDAFLARSSSGTIALQGDLLEWLQASESLARWSASRDEYARLLGAMKQSSLR